MEKLEIKAVPPLDLKAQLGPIREEILNAVTGVIDSTQYIMGPKIEEFERAIADYTGAKHAIGVSSGTDALLLALMALNVGPDDAVITSVYSFFASAGVIARLNAQPIFVDIDPETYNISPECLRQTLESMSQEDRSKVKAILPVHLYGQSAEMDAIVSIAKLYNISVVEDAAQAIGAEYSCGGERKCVGTIGDIGCYSFFPTKNLGGIGDAGMVVTNNDRLAQLLRLKRVHGAQSEYCHEVIGGNFRLDPIQAAVLLVKLPHLEKWHNSRQANANYYIKSFEEHQPVQIVLPYAIYKDNGMTHPHIYNQFMVRTPQRKELQAFLTEKNINSRIYYPIPFHLQDCFKHLGYKRGDFPVAEYVAQEIMSLPIYPELTDAMQDYVVDAIFSFTRNN